MVQINPLAAPEGAAQIKQQLTALESALKASATKQGMALTSLAVQYHSGVANAAPATAPFTPFGVLGPLAAAAAAGGGEGEQDVDMSEAEGGEQVLGITDALCELKFRVSPTAFYQVCGRGGRGEPAWQGGQGGASVAGGGQGGAGEAGRRRRGAGVAEGAGGAGVAGGAGGGASDSSGRSWTGSVWGAGGLGWSWGCRCTL
jgi:hypothetical protein